MNFYCFQGDSCCSLFLCFSRTSEDVSGSQLPSCISKMLWVPRLANTLYQCCHYKQVDNQQVDNSREPVLLKKFPFQVLFYRKKIVASSQK